MSKMLKTVLCSLFVACLIGIGAPDAFAATDDAAAQAPAQAKVASAKSTAVSELTITAKTASGAKGYQFKVSTNKKFTKNVKTKSSTKRKVTFSNLKAGKKYFVKVRAYAKTGSGKAWGKWSALKTATVAIPGTPTISSASSPEVFRLKASVKKAKYAVGYQYMIATDKGFTKNKESMTAVDKTVTFTGIKAGTRYVKARAYTLVGSKKVWGKWSAAKAVTVRSQPIATITVQGYDPIRIVLDPTDAPKTVANFRKLANAKFYDGLTFHRVHESFALQGGDPKADGTGSTSDKAGFESYGTIEGEFSANGKTNALADDYAKGVVGMARGDDYNSASCQFFITLANTASSSLNGNYAAFGTVASADLATVDKIVSTHLQYATGTNGVIPSKENQPVIKSIRVTDITNPSAMVSAEATQLLPSQL